MRLDDITGQERAVGRVREILKNDAPGHAYIFSGPEGIGKRTVAFAFAAALLCPSGSKGGSCGTCRMCRMLDSGSAPDFHMIDSDESSIGVDEIRFIQGDTVKRPMYSCRKVYLICNAGKMTLQAQNCILKTLEEPPGFTVVILTTSNYNSLIETVRSRAVRIELQRRSPEDIRRIINDIPGSKKVNTDFAVSYAEGIIGKALGIAGSGYLKEVRERLTDMVFRLRDADVDEALECIDFFNEHKGKIQELLGILQSIYRDLLAAGMCRAARLINSDKKDIIIGNADMFTQEKLLRNIYAARETAVMLTRNSAFQLAVEVMLLRLQED